MSAQAFSHVYGGYGYDAAYGVAQLAAPDSGYVMVGSTTSFGNNPDVYMIRTDKLGMIEWTKNYGGNNIDRAEKVIQTQDEGFAIVGYTNSSGNGGYDVLLMKTDADGELLWEKTYGGEDWDFGYDIKETDDGDLILVGETFSFGSGDADVYVIKTNADGDTLWTRTYGGENTDIGNALDIDTENRIVVVGETNSFGEDYDGYVLRLDQDGDTLWTYRFDLGEYDAYTGVRAAAQGSGYLLVGITDDDTEYDAISCFVHKLDYSANPSWGTHRMLGGDFEDYCHSVDEFDNEEFILSGFSKSIISQNRFSLVLWKLSPSGWSLGGYSRAGDNEIFVHQSITTLDQGTASTGLTDSWGNGAESVFLFKTGNDIIFEDTEVYDDPFVSVKEISDGNQAAIYPNPVDREILIDASFNNYMLQLYSIDGKLIFNKHIQGKSAIIQRPESIDSGFYVYSIIKENELISSGKLVFK